MSKIATFKEEISRLEKLHTEGAALYKKFEQTEEEARQNRLLIMKSQFKLQVQLELLREAVQELEGIVAEAQPADEHAAQLGGEYAHT